jgi:hypothetical protein
MALVGFKHSPLPSPPQGYDAQYVRQLVRVIELYFNQLDSQTPNQAQSYAAKYFYNIGYSVVADLPAATDYKGARTFVTDAAAAPVFRAVVTGGGSVFTPVFSDGTNWRNG